MYLGVAVMLLGSYIILGDALSLTPSIVAALGGFIFSIGLIMSFVGFKGKDKETILVEMTRADSELGKNPLGYLNAATERVMDKEKKANGNRAIGFVLI